MVVEKIMKFLPEVKSPEKKLSLKTKLKWTGIILLIYFILGFIPLFGLGENALQQFEFLSIVLGAQFGSLISLGIGPIVTASIILQLLVGAGILKYDLSTQQDKLKFEALQKILGIAFVIFEAVIYVLMGGLSTAPYYDPATNSFLTAPIEGAIALSTSQISLLTFFLILQLAIGGFLIMLMDEVVSKWGIGSGISLFIAAGVSQQLFVSAFSWVSVGQGLSEYPAGAIPTMFLAVRNSDLTTAMLSLSSIFFTIVVFLMAIYAQSMKVEIPLSYSKVRGFGIKWPLNFIYTSNIPIILTAALFGNIEIFATLLENSTAGASEGFLHFVSVNILGQTNTINAGKGIIQWIRAPQVVNSLITGTFTLRLLLHTLVYILLMMGFSILFSLIWVQTSGQDAKTVSNQITASGLQIPGFRSDKRILEKVLNRYIWPLAVMGAGFVAFLAALADISGALSRGTGILLTVMIVYKFYDTIQKEHSDEMSPAMKRFFKS